MNELVEYLEKHHSSGGNALNHVRVDDLLKETEWTLNEIFTMALEAREAKIVSMSIKTGYRIRDNDPEGLDLIGIWNTVYGKWESKAKKRYKPEMKL